MSGHTQVSGGYQGGIVVDSGAGCGVVQVLPETKRGKTKVGPIIVRPGGEGVSYRHVQTTPSDEWIINHNLGYKPVHSVIDALGRGMLSGFQHLSNNQLRLFFSTPQAGEARLV